MSTEERGGGGGGQGSASCQFGRPLKPLPPRMSRAEIDQGGLDPPPPAVSPSVAAAGFGSQAAAGSPPAVTGGSLPAPENEQGGLHPTAAAGSGFQVAAAGGTSPAGTPLVSSGSAEPEVQQRSTRNLASRCYNFRFDDRKLWVCAAGVLLVLPLLLGSIYLFFSL